MLNKVELATFLDLIAASRRALNLLEMLGRDDGDTAEGLRNAIARAESVMKR